MVDAAERYLGVPDIDLCQTVSSTAAPISATWTAAASSRWQISNSVGRLGLAKIAWPDRAIAPGWTEAMVAMSVRQRDLFGFPPPDSDYWTPETLAGVAARYPRMDMGAYR